jgi:hypothetical protein
LLRELAAWWEIILVAAASPREHDRTSSLGVATYIPVKTRGNIATMPWQLETEALSREAVRAVQAKKPACALLWSGIEFLAPDLDVPAVLGDRIDCATLAQMRDFRTGSAVDGRWYSFKQALKASAYERKIVRHLAATTVVGEADARVLRWISRRNTVHLVPNGTALRAPPSLSSEAARPSIIFGGTLGYRPNADAARFFATDVLPMVQARIPEARFIIAGWGGPPDVLSLGELPGIEIRSDVPDMGVELEAAWVSVAPMRFGGGMQNKVLEAWAAGKPVVMTTVAAKGLGAHLETGSLIADRPEGLAEAVAHLLSEPAERLRLGEAGYDLVRKQYTWTGAAQTVTDLLGGQTGDAVPTGSARRVVRGSPEPAGSSGRSPRAKPAGSGSPADPTPHV